MFLLPKTKQWDGMQDINFDLDVKIRFFSNQKTINSNIPL